MKLWDRDAVFQDLRFGLRMIRRRPGLTVAAVLTLALGVGANTAVVSVLQTALLNPLGLRQAGRVMVARVRIDKLQMRDVQTSGVEFRELQEMTEAFSAVAAMEGRWWTSHVQGEAARLRGQAVTADFFRLFGEQPMLGRFFTADDREAVVLSHGFWRSQFGSDPSVLGRALMLDDKPHRVVGVAPAGFRFPATAQAWTPLVLAPDRLQRRGYNMSLWLFVRLKDGVTPPQAADRVRRHVAALKSSAGGAELSEYGYAIDLAPLAHFVAGDLRRPLWLLWAAAWVLLLTGCANVGGLLLARSAPRRREMAIRISLGATRWQILRQLLVESLSLGLLGGAAGLLVATFAVSLLPDLPIPAKPVLTLVTLDWRLLCYGVSLALLSGVFFGLAPALQLLRESQSAAMVRHRRRWFQDGLVTAEVAGTLALLVVAGLLVRSLWTIQHLPLGFDPDRLTTAFLLKPHNDPGFLTRLEETLRATPGLEAVALAYPVPFSGGELTSSFKIRNRERQPGEPEWHGEAYFVSPDYFQALRIPLLRGRRLLDSDSSNAPLVCMIDAKLAERFFPNQDAIGQEIGMYRGWARIVGVVGTIRGTTLEEGSRPVAYYSLPQVPLFPQAAIVVRSRGPAVPAIRAAVRRANPQAPLFDVRSMAERIGESLGIRRVVVWLLGIFGVISLLLATVGLHSVVAQVVGERTGEIGIRMALGAQPGQILAQFMRHGLRSGVLGILIGLAGAAYAQRWLTGLLYQVKPFDLVSFSAASLGILALLSLAVWRPARRASRIDPQAALRYE